MTKGIVNSKAVSISSRMSNISVLLNGYDLDPIGLGADLFYVTYILSLICLGISLIAYSIVAYQTLHDFRNFYQQQCHERFLGYLAVVGIIFVLVNILDRMQIVSNQQFSTPSVLCFIYGFISSFSFASQMMLTNYAIFNSFLYYVFKKPFLLGKWDMRLALYVFGLPFLAMGITAVRKNFGPDGVRYDNLWISRGYHIQISRE